MSNKMFQNAAILNHIFVAYFQNEADKFGVNFEDSKPTLQEISRANSGQYYFTPGTEQFGLKEFYHGKIVIEYFDTTIFNKEIDEWINCAKDKIIDLAKDFAQAVSDKKYCDFVFSALPDGNPYIYVVSNDPDTNFRSRLILGHNFGENNISLVWEFYCLLMIRYREVENHPIYGQTYKNVDEMTDEEREKFNKQPISEN